MAAGPFLAIRLVVLVILSAAIIGLAIGLWALLKRRHRSAESTCGNCGYPVKGLPTFTCPECGADLREVGILAQGFRSPFSPRLKLTLWTLLLPLPAIVVIGFIASSVPQIKTVDIDVYLTPTSGTFRGIEVGSEATGISASPLPHRIDICMLGSNPAPCTTFFPPDRLGQKTLSGPEDLSTAIEDWWKQWAVPANDQTAAEARELASHLIAISAGANPQQLRLTAFKQSGSAMGATSGLAPAWPFILGGLIAVIVWAWGAWRLRRSSRRPTAAQPKTSVESARG